MLLWKSIAFGPIQSRRLGKSLGINLLDTKKKICSFNCIYCECGWTEEKKLTDCLYYPLADVLQSIEEKLIDCRKNGMKIDSITFSGNGEPTLHPEFGEIVTELLRLRAQYYPQAVITCLSNATQLHRIDVREALYKIENPMLKLDAGTEDYFQLINAPTTTITLVEIMRYLSDFQGNLIIQTLFLKGVVKEIAFDNSSEPHFSAWLNHIQSINLKKLYIYSLDRVTPVRHLVKFSYEELEPIADKIRAFGLDVGVY
ncbi:MAG: radical SAM protein [Bacteroidales bacterium]|jgi:wyosine [tRNA(Phe)-imidazoG37] synthetase (radical SAM superfamily)|nr:radical SAM protein [Bacteroidales bacterium]